ncbi:hypothetical protein LTR02_015228 [Friedmanniomyces endolithicus]|nr:hypothetical protein LTR02_015228 [Friedmanniomyces endolithicus]
MVMKQRSYVEDGTTSVEVRASHSSGPSCSDLPKRRLLQHVPHEQQHAFEHTTQRRAGNSKKQCLNAYGSANEPPPHLGGGKSLGPFVQRPQAEQTKLPKIGERLQRSGEEEIEEDRVEATGDTKQHDEPTTPTTVDSGIATYAGSDTKLDAAKSSATEDLLSQPSPSDARSVESLLDSIPGPAMPKDFTEPQARPEQNPEDPPLDHTTDEHSPPMKAPHLDQPRYVHHFDTYGLVKQLTSSGWSATHATLVMKAVRMMLADNMELAKTLWSRRAWSRTRHISSGQRARS